MVNQKHIEAYYDLFEYLSREHGLVLLVSTMDEIIDLSTRAVKKYNDANESQPQADEKKVVLYYF